MSDFSIVEYLSDHSGYKCGYCKNPTSAFSRGMWSHSLNVEDYQDLIDRGWRRSGKYCYKPTMSLTCCPQYAIRCVAQEFAFSKSKKKVAKRMLQFILSGGQEDLNKWKEHCSKKPSNMDVFLASDIEHDHVVKKGTLDHSADVVSFTQEMTEIKSCMESSTASVSYDQTTATPQSQHGLGPDPSKPPCRKAKLLRREKRLEKLQKKGGNPSVEVTPCKNNAPKQLEQCLPHLMHLSDAKFKLQVRLVLASFNDEEFLRTKQESLKIYQKYQCTIHKDTLNDCDEKQWKRFLVDTPLNFDEGGPGRGFGTFHNQYWLDDKLIAVGVVDVLPKCISSVYLYYDPDYGFLSLGVYSALSEIVLTKQFQKEVSSIEYYYMGYYIHSCPKMRYKGAYDPSFLLCPETYKWVPLSKCVATLDEHKYARLNVLNGGSAEERDGESRMSSLNPVRILFQRHIMDYGHYNQFERAMDRNLSPASREQEDKEVEEYVSLVGRTCAKRLLLYRS